MGHMSIIDGEISQKTQNKRIFFIDTYPTGHISIKQNKIEKKMEKFRIELALSAKRSDKCLNDVVYF